MFDISIQNYFVPLLIIFMLILHVAKYCIPPEKLSLI